MKISHYFICLLIISSFISVAALVDDKNLSGTLVVVNKNDDTVDFIDLKTRQIKVTRETGKGPHELAMSADGRIAVVTNYIGGNSLTIF